MFGQYVRNDILILSLCLGYSLMLLFFFTTDNWRQARRYWDTLEWGERIILGFLLGLMMLFVASTGVYNLVREVRGRFLLVAPADEVLETVFWSFLALLLGGLLLRFHYEEPLCSQRVHEGFAKFRRGRFGSKLLVEGPIAAFLLLGAIGAASELAYPVGGEYIETLWFGLFWGSFFLALFSIWVPFLVFNALSSFGVQRTLLEDKITQSAESSLRKVLLPLFSWVEKVRRRWKTLLTLFIIIALGLTMPFADSRTGVLFPRMAYVETPISDEIDVFGNVTDYVALVGVDGVLTLSTPYLPLVRNVTFANPSNYSRKMSEHFGMLGPEGRISAKLVGARVAIQVIGARENEVLAFNVIWEWSAEIREIVVQTRFYNELDLTQNLIIVNSSDRVPQGNDTFAQRIQLVFRNGMDRTVAFNLLRVTRVGNEIMSYACDVNGNATDLCFSAGRDLMISSFSIEPGESRVFTISLLYK